MQEKHEYLLIGNGLLAKHLIKYFGGIGIDMPQWIRGNGEQADSYIQSANKILVAISDDSLPGFINQFKSKFPEKIFIHFSGALTLPNAESVHPLMTFSKQLYPLEFYKTIPLITEKGKIPFKILFPQLNNPVFEIAGEEKSFYHAWCTIAGNFSTIIWQAFEERMDKRFNIPKDALLPYLNQTLMNFAGQDNSLTGPFVRGDFSTIAKHRTALAKDNFLHVYEAFYSLFFERKGISK
jgi:predicted short-subunit dehydrogenase-like oxidoreductase (DUF2520 family)